MNKKKTRAVVWEHKTQRRAENSHRLDRSSVDLRAKKDDGPEINGSAVIGAATNVPGVVDF